MQCLGSGEAGLNPISVAESDSHTRSPQSHQSSNAFRVAKVTVDRAKSASTLASRCEITAASVTASAPSLLSLSLHRHHPHPPSTQLRAEATHQEKVSDGFPIRRSPPTSTLSFLTAQPSAAFSPSGSHHIEALAAAAHLTATAAIPASFSLLIIVPTSPNSAQFNHTRPHYATPPIVIRPISVRFRIHLARIARIASLAASWLNIYLAR